MKVFEHMDVSTLQMLMCVAAIGMAVAFCLFLYLCYQEYKRDLRNKAMERRAERFERRMAYEAIKEASWEEIKRAVRR